MKTSIPSVEQLKRAIAITEQIEKLEAELASILGGKIKLGRRPKLGSDSDKPKVKRVLSPEAKAKIVAAQKRRWAKVKKAEKAAKAAE